MALIGIDKDEVKEFTSKFDTGEPKTVFEIGIITQKDRLKLFREFQGVDKDFDVVKMQEKSYEVLKIGLKKVKNLFDKKSGKHKDYTEITDEVLDKLPIGVIGELVSEIMQSNSIKEQEAKN